MEDIDQLIYLYSQAIENYEGVDADKHACFYHKTQKLLNKPSVFEAMKSRPISKKEEEKDEEQDQVDEIEKQVDSPIKRHNRIREQSNSFYAPNRKKLEMDLLLMQDQKKDAEKILLTKHTHGDNLKSELLQSDMLTQKRNLEMRLFRRKAKKCFKRE